MEIAQLADPESFEVGMKVWNRHIDFHNLKVCPLHDRAKRSYHERRGDRNSSGGLNEPPAFGRMGRRAGRGKSAEKQVNSKRSDGRHPPDVSSRDEHAANGRWNPQQHVSPAGKPERQRKDKCDPEHVQKTGKKHPVASRVATGILLRSAL